MRASRVIEAAMRAADQTRINHPVDMAMLLQGFSWAIDTTSPIGAAHSTDMMRNR
jgi:hypothetical protein